MSRTGRIDWKGKPEQLSLGDCWETPGGELFLGAYDFRYRFHRLGLMPLADAKSDEGE